MPAARRLLLPRGDQEPFLSLGLQSPKMIHKVSLRAWQRPHGASSACQHRTAWGAHTKLLRQNTSNQNPLWQKITARMSNSLLPSFVPKKKACPMALSDRLEQPWL